MKRLFILLLLLMCLLLFGCSQSSSIIVPDVIGIDEKSAEQIIINAGLVPEINYVNHETYEKGKVTYTFPEAGYEIDDENKRVQLFVSIGKSESAGVWQMSYYVDEFKNPTNNGYITASVNGVFSNTATTDSKLTAKFIVDSDNFSIKLYEYGSQEVKSTGFESYAITILDTDGTKHYIHGLIQKNGDRIEIRGDDKVELLKAFQKEGTISFYIEETNRPTTNYLFSVETSNFVDVYNTVCGKIDTEIEYIEENPITLRIGICPFSDEDNPYVNELAGMIYGFDIDYIKEIAYQLGYTDDKIEFKMNAFDELFNGLDSDEYDIIISAIEYTKERSIAYSASKVYLNNDDGNFVIYSSQNRMPLIDKINTGIDALNSDGTTATLIDKWFEN